MKKLLYIIMLALPLVFWACDNDDVDGPSGSGLSIVFPQGNNDYDREFVSFKEQYGSMVLYKFSNAQFRWAVNEYIPYYGTEAKEADIAKAWGLVKDGVSVWPEDFVKKCLPYQILLCDSVYSLWDNDAGTGKDKKLRNSCCGFNHIAFAFANDRINPQDVETKREAVGDVAYAMISYAISKNIITVPERFDTLFTKWKVNYPTYTTNGEIPSGAWGYNGAAAMDGSVEAKTGYTLAHDFASYVKYIVTCSPATFEERYLNDTFDCGGSQYDADWNLIPEHRIRQKYEAVLDYFRNELGIDLSAIGTQTEQMR